MKIGLQRESNDSRETKIKRAVKMENLFACSWESNRSFVRVTHRDGDQHVMTWDGKVLGDDWMVPAASFLSFVDGERSLAEADKHSLSARAAAERFVRQK
jgi:hypothetical protein